MKKIFLGFFVLLLFFSFLPNLTEAKGLVPCGGTGEAICDFFHVPELIHNVLCFFLLPCSLNNGFPLIPTIATLMLIIAGFYFIISGVNPKQFAKAKTIITAVVIGLVIIFMSWMLLNTFLSKIGAADWVSSEESWWVIECPQN